MKKLMTMALLAAGLFLVQASHAEAAKKKSVASAKKVTAIAKKAPKTGLSTKSSGVFQKVFEVLGVNQCNWDCGKANSRCAGAGTLCSTECRNCLAGLNFKVVVKAAPSVK